MFFQCRLDIARLHPVTPYLHHMILASDVHIIAIFLQAHTIAGRIWPTPMFWLSPVADHYCSPGDHQLSFLAGIGNGTVVFLCPHPVTGASTTDRNRLGAVS